MAFDLFGKRVPEPAAPALASGGFSSAHQFVSPRS